MPTEDGQQKLAEIVKTADGRQRLVAQIDSLINAFSKINPPDAAEIQKNYPMVHEILPGANQELLLKLKQDLQNLEEFTVNAPSAAQDQISEITHKWCKNNVGDNILVNIVPSKEVLGGVTCSYKGRYRDFSLDKIIKEKVYAQI